MLERAGMEARLDPDRGLDHGVWVPLSLAFPEATVPVIQVSLPLPSTPAMMLRMGQALAPLRLEHILLVATGGIVHNLARLQPDMDTPFPEPWAAEFDGWVREKVGALDARRSRSYPGWRRTHAQLCPPRSTSTRCCSQWGPPCPAMLCMTSTTGSGTARSRCARSR